MLRNDVFTGPLYILVQRGDDDEPTYEGQFSKFVQVRSENNELGVVAFSKKKDAIAASKGSKSIVAGFMQPNELCKFLLLAQTLGPTHIVLDPIGGKGGAVKITSVLERFMDRSDWNQKSE